MPKQIAKEIESLYVKLYNRISMIKFGEKLPSYRQLLQEYECSRQVLNKTLQKLQADGVIIIEDRIGIFANLKNNDYQKKIIFSHADWVCEHIKYFSRELENQLKKQGNYIFMELPYAPDAIDSLPDKLKNSNADLILLDLENFDCSTIGKLESIMDKIIFFESSPMLHKINAIDLQPFFSGMMAAQHLIELGHREIALIASEPRLFPNKEKIYGFLDYLKLHGVKPKIIDCKIKSGFAAASFTADFMDNYVKNNPIDFTACFALSNSSALEVIKVLRANNIRVPEDVSVIGCSGENYDLSQEVELSSISYNYEKIIEVTAKNIELFFRTGRCGTTRIPPILIQNSSTTKYVKKELV